MALSDKLNTSNPALDKLSSQAEQGKQDLENLLLKEALAMSSENCEKLLLELKDLLRMVEENRKNENAELLNRMKELNNTAKNLKTQNEAMSDQLHTMMTGMKDEVVQVVQENVKKGLAMNIKAMNQATTELENQVDKNNKEMNEHVKRYKKNQENFFKMNGIRNVIFWAGQIATIVSLLLLFYIIFGSFE